MRRSPGVGESRGIAVDAAAVQVTDQSYVEVHDESQLALSRHAEGYARDRARVTAREHARLEAYDSTTISGRDYAHLSASDATTRSPVSSRCARRQPS